MPLDPQTRLHMGLSLNNGVESKGITGGMDSRLSRFISIDVSGFISASETFTLTPDESDSTVSDWVTLRHGLYAAPGIRVPHRYGEGLVWDLFFRVGFGSVWSQDASNEYDWLFDAALLGGVDALVRQGPIGVRVAAKGFFYKTYPNIAWTKNWSGSELLVMSPQVTVEALYQF